MIRQDRCIEGVGVNPSARSVGGNDEWLPAAIPRCSYAICGPAGARSTAGHYVENAIGHERMPARVAIMFNDRCADRDEFGVAEASVSIQVRPVYVVPVAQSVTRVIDQLGGHGRAVERPVKLGTLMGGPAQRWTCA